MHDQLIKVHLAGGDQPGETLWAIPLSEPFTAALDNSPVFHPLGIEDVVRVDQDGIVTEVLARSSLTTFGITLGDPIEADDPQAAIVETFVSYLRSAVKLAGGEVSRPLGRTHIVVTVSDHDALDAAMVLVGSRMTVPEGLALIRQVGGAQLDVVTLSSPTMPIGPIADVLAEVNA